MADNTKQDASALVSTEEVSTLNGGAVTAQHAQRVIPSLRTADGTAVDVTKAAPLPVEDGGGSLTVDSTALGGTTDAEATGNGSIIGLLKRLRTLLAGGLPSALTGSGNLKVAVQENSLTAPLGVRLTDGAEAIGVTAKRLHVDDGGSSLSVDDNGGSLTVDGAVSLAAAVPAGNNNIGDVDVASIAAGANLIGNIGLGVRTSGGLTPFRSLDIDETEEEVKATAGQLYWYHFDNDATSKRYLKFYNDTAANVVVGTTTPVLTLPLPKESSGHVPIPQGFAFSKAITVACTTGRADNDTEAPGANEVAINLGYA